MPKSIHKNNRGRQSGFGLVELLVTISIMAMVSSVILIGQSAFNSAILLRGQAYEVAFRTREVQLMAVGVAVAGTDFRRRYGLQFSTQQGNNHIYRVFVDNNRNGRYDSPDETLGQPGILDSRFEIRDLRIDGVSFGTDALVTVLFERPNFDAHFFDSAGTPLLTAGALAIDVGVRGDAGAVRTVEITKVGQIAVN
jgi:prepilin-type N-terminal cleavage/methylation domain-containing protein